MDIPDTHTMQSDTVAVTTYSILRPELPLDLHEYQVQGVEFIRAKQRAILADKVGLGKTVQALASATRPLLVVCPKMAFGVWESELQKWLQLSAITYKGPQYQRTALLAAIKESKEPIVITNYALMKELLPVQKFWGTIVFDEAHLLKNPKAKTMYNVARRFQCKFLYLLTATPASHGAKDLWTLLNLCAPWRFRSYWDFVNRYAMVYDNGFGKVVEGTNPAHIDELQQLLAQYMIRRTPEEVNLQLPPMSRQFIPLELTPAQRRAYEQLSRELMLELENDDVDLPKLLITPNEISKIIRLRQLLVHPGLIDHNGGSAIFDALAEELPTIDEPIVIFTPFAQAVPLLMSVTRIAGFKSYSIIGGLEADEITQTIAQFQRGGKQAIVATLRMGQSWTATAARLAYMVGFDWNPDIHEQAEGRIRRISQTRPTLVKYFIHPSTVDQHIVDILNRKVTWRDLILNPKALLSPNPNAGHGA